MWVYEKKLQYPIKIKNPNAALAKIIISQLGGPDGELAASTRYLSQRYSMPCRKIAGILTDVGTSEPKKHLFSPTCFYRTASPAYSISEQEETIMYEINPDRTKFLTYLEHILLLELRNRGYLEERELEYALQLLYKDNGIFPENAKLTGADA